MKNKEPSLKEKYLELEKKFKLPKFEEMNKYFYIEKIEDFETELLTREIRKFIYEKFSTYFKVIEAILNPANAQAFVLNLIKSITSEDKEKLSKIYDEFLKKEIDVLILEIEFSLEKEIEFIKSSFEIWKKYKDDLTKIFGSLKFEKKKNNYIRNNYFN